MSNFKITLQALVAGTNPTTDELLRLLEDEDEPATVLEVLRSARSSGVGLASDGRWYTSEQNQQVRSAVEENRMTAPMEELLRLFNLHEKNSQTVPTPYDRPKTSLEKAMFPLLREAFLNGRAAGISVQLSKAEVDRRVLTEAYFRGAESMADQISEDQFGGRLEFSPQFTSLYEEDVEYSDYVQR